MHGRRTHPHLASELIDLLQRCRIILGKVMKLVQLRQTLAVGLFRIPRDGRIVWTGGAAIAIEVIVAGVDVVVGRADGTPTRAPIADVAAWSLLTYPVSCTLTETTALTLLRTLPHLAILTVLRLAGPLLLILSLTLLLALSLPHSLAVLLSALAPLSRLSPRCISPSPS